MTSFLQLAVFFLLFARVTYCWPGGAPRCVYSPFHVNKSTGKVYPGPSKLEVSPIFDSKQYSFIPIQCIFSPPQDDFSFDVKLPSANDHEGMIELKVTSVKEFLGILVTTDFYEAERRPDMSLGHWWINDSQWFKAVEDTPDPCGISHKK